MIKRLPQETPPIVATLDDLAPLADYSLMDTLNCDPEGKANGADHAPRQVFSGHYVPVKPDRKSTRLNSSHLPRSRMPSSA